MKTTCPIPLKKALIGFGNDLISMPIFLSPKSFQTNYCRFAFVDLNSIYQSVLPSVFSNQLFCHSVMLNTVIIINYNNRYNL